MISHTFVVRSSNWSSDPVEQLHGFRSELRRLQQTAAQGRETLGLRLHLLHVTLDLPVIQALVDLLTLELQQPLIASTTKDDASSKLCWRTVYFRHCQIPVPLVVLRQNSQERNVLSFQDCHHLVSTLSSRVSSLVLEESSSLVEGLLSHAVSLGSIASLSIHQQRHFSETSCFRLGILVRKSNHLQELYLKSTILDAPDRLAIGLASAVHLETLSLVGVLDGQAGARQRRQGLADLVVPAGGDDDDNNNNQEYGCGAIDRLLQNPASQLKRLNLSNMGLQDDHFLALTTRLSDTPSRLVEWNLSFNHIHAKSILEFSKKLHRIPSLKQISLRPNPWADDVVSAEECGAALLQAMSHNSSVEYLDSLLGIPQASLLRYYATLNRAGRRILKCQVPLGLWANILERAGTKLSYYYVNPPAGHLQLHLDDREVKATAVYFLLQNSPVISIWSNS